MFAQAVAAPSPKSPAPVWRNTASISTKTLFRAIALTASTPELSRRARIAARFAKALATLRCISRSLNKI